MSHPEALRKWLLDLLAIPSPCGFTDDAVHYIASQLKALGIGFDLTRRGTLRAHVPGAKGGQARAIVCHVDSIGAMVRRLRSDGRIDIAPIGYWSARFAEGARVTLFSQGRAFRGTLLPRVKWGVSRDAGVDSVPMDWDHLELRLDESVFSNADLRDLGIEVGNFIALDSNPEFLDNGFVVGRGLDNKAGVAAVLAALAQIREQEIGLPQDIYILFTVTETIGTGTGSALLPEVSELVTVDFASVPAHEKSLEKRVTIAAGDSSGPYDYHLTAHLRQLAQQSDIPHAVKLLEAYHSDAAAALAAGHDVRTAVIAYAGDASHSMERTHIDSLRNISRLLVAYASQSPTFAEDPQLTTVEHFSRQIDAKHLPPARTRLPEVADLIKSDKRETE